MCFFVANPSQVQAQTNLVINGIVQDQTGAAFLGARADLLKDGEPQRTTVTDASGSFRFERVQPGNYEVRVRQEGFKTESTIPIPPSITVRDAVASRSPRNRAHPNIMGPSIFCSATRGSTLAIPSPQ